MIKNALVICVTTALFLAGQTFAADSRFSASCNNLAKHQTVNVVALPVTTEPISIRPVKEIALLGAPGSNRSDAVIFGVTIARPEFTLDYSLDTLTDPKTGLSCLVPSIQLSLAYAPLTVVIAQELGKDSCMRSAAELHEAEHVSAYRNHLDSVRQALTESIHAAIGGHVFYSAEPDASNSVSDRLDALLEPIVRQHYRLVDLKHAEIDSPEHLESFRLSCSGQVNNLAYRIIQARSL